MAPSVRVVRTRAEFDAVMSSQWAGFTAPSSPFWELWFPVDKGAHLGPDTSKPDLDGAIRESCDRMWAEHQASPVSTWIYVADDEAEQKKGENSTTPYVLGSCQWRVYKTNPFPDLPRPRVSSAAWVSGSEENEFTANVAAQIFKPRFEWMARPHVGLSWMAVRPGQRGKAIGFALMQYGTTLADELGLESMMEATELGKFLYARHGFRSVQEMRVSIPAEGPPIQTAMAKKYGFDNESFRFAIMWRPIGGVWNDASEEVWEERRAAWVPEWTN